VSPDERPDRDVRSAAGTRRCTVADDGGRLDDPAPVGGFGLVVVHEPCDSVQIRTGPTGTRVTAVRPAVRTVSVDGAAAAPRSRAVRHQPLRVVDIPGGVPGDPRRIEVAGAVDAATVDDLRGAILRRSAGGPARCSDAAPDGRPGRPTDRGRRR